MNFGLIVGLLLLLALAGGAAATLAKKPGSRDDAPSSEEVIRQARERGIEGTIMVPDRGPVYDDAAPVRHEPFLLIPHGWDGPELYEWQAIADPAPPSPGASTTEETRASPLWREPRYIPSGYALDRAWSERLNVGLTLLYKDPLNESVEIIIWHPQGFPILIWTWGNDPALIHDLTAIDGMPAVLSFGGDTPAGEFLGTTLWAYDEPLNTAYIVNINPKLDRTEVVKVLRGLR